MSQDQQEPILKLAGLHKSFNGFTALDSVDLSVEEGEFLAIVGPSGSGKTTLIRLLVGMDEQTEGTIWLRRNRLDTMAANKRPTCMVFQSLALFPHRTVGQNIEFPLKIRKVDGAERKERALELLNLLRLPEDYYGRRITECSGGERQRIALARALAFDPEILFFDEPLSALDYRLRKTLEKELKDLHQRTGKTFVYITHSLEEAMVMSDRIAIMRKGKFEQIGKGEDIYSRPESRFVAEFMGEVNLFQVRSTGAPTDVGGLTVEREAGHRKLEGAKDGANLMVRPEKLRVLEGGEESDFTATGHVEANYLLGSRRQYEITCGGEKPLIVEIVQDGSTPLAAGETVRLGFDADEAHLIEKD